jgi:hypothetical protein
MKATEGIYNFPYPPCNLPIGGDLLKPSGIVAYLKRRRVEARCVEKHAINQEMLRHEGRSESDCLACPNRESAQAGLILEFSMQGRRISSDGMGNSLGKDS